MEVDDGPSEPNATLFVKNINYNTTEDAVHSLFATVGPVRFAA